MKKFILLLFLFFAFSLTNSYTQILKSRKYIDTQGFSGTASINLKKYEDFENLINRWDIEVILRKINKENTSKQTVEFLFSREGVLYIFDSTNFLTMKDYEKGLELGISDGMEYYFYKNSGIYDLDELEYFKYQPVFADSDIKLFRNGGFRGASKLFLKEGTHTVYYPAEIKKNDYDTFIKLQILKGLGYKQNDSWLDYRNNLEKTLSDIKNKKIDIIYDKNQRINLSSLNIPSNILSKKNTISLEEYPGNSTLNISDFEIYYYSKLNGIKYFSEYLELCTLRYKAYKSNKDYELARKLGFSRSSEFYDSFYRGFPDKKEYDLFSNLVKNYSDSNPLRNLKNNLKNINSKYVEEIKDPNDYIGAFIIFCILKNVTAASLTTDKIAEICRKEYDISVFKNLNGRIIKSCDLIDARIADIDSKIVHSYLEKMNIKKIGIYNVKGRVFRFNKS